MFLAWCCIQNVAHKKAFNIKIGEGFLTFSGGIEMEHQAKIGKWKKNKIFYVGKKRNVNRLCNVLTMFYCSNVLFYIVVFIRPMQSMWSCEIVYVCLCVCMFVCLVVYLWASLVIFIGISLLDALDFLHVIAFNFLKG